MAGALDGVRVVDFGQYIAGPLAAMLLADQGADVVRVDPPGGPRWDTPANATWNRGKRSIALDLSSEPDREVARGLIRRADVVIENFRPGVMDRLGLGANSSTARNGRLVYCSLPGFASDDPRASMAAWEGVIAAASGTYRAPSEDAAPVFTAIPIASTFAAFLGAIGITAALFSRERDGRGQRIEVPLFDAMFAAIGANGLAVGGGGGGGRPNDFGGGTFRCADGRWVHVQLAKPKFVQRFAAAAGLEGRFDIARLGTEREHRVELAAALPEVFLGRSADEWEQLGAQADLPLIKVRSAAEWIELPHARDSHAVVPIDDPLLGQMWQPNSPVRLSASGLVPSRPAALLDADREAILAEIAQSLGDAAGATSTRRRSALEGVRVLDLSQVLAGPTAGRTLAELGAVVTKVNPPAEEGAGIRFSLHRYHTDVNRGKRSVLLDLKQPGAHEVIERILDETDVVVHNFRPGALERLGIGYEQVRAHRPGIVYVGISAYGQGGDWGSRPGYETFGQAPTGLMERQGGDGRPAGQPFAVNDYGTGLMGAFAALLALFHRERSGQGQHAEAALAFTGTILQSPYLQSYTGKRWDEPRGAEARGFGPLQRLYRGADAWFFLGATTEQLDDLGAVEGLTGVATLSTAALAEELERRFAEAPTAIWTRRLAAHGIGAHRLRGVAELMGDAWVVSHGLSVTRAHDTGDEITTVGPAIRMSATPAMPGDPAHTPGADTREVIAAVGLDAEFAALIATGAAAEAVTPLD
jgi:crotonobetainyl-CoA:carnitine CoA-transferase CaiB-like acyl-CoA transferase